MGNQYWLIASAHDFDQDQKIVEPFDTIEAIEQRIKSLLEIKSNYLVSGYLFSTDIIRVISGKEIPFTVKIRQIDEVKLSE